MLKFETYAGNDTSNLTELGTLANAVGKNGTISFIRKNFNDATKRVALLLKNAKGESCIVTCSQQVSNALRAKELTISQLAGLGVLENENGVAFVSMPAGGGLQTFNVKDLKPKTVELSANFLPEELIALD